MTIRVPIETAERDLRSLLEELGLGETATLVDSGGKPEALLISLRSVEREAESESDWEDRWDELARKVDRAWQSNKGVVETLTEMRR
jgi:hypothetical protein